MRRNQIVKPICRTALLIGCSSMLMFASNVQASPAIAISVKSPVILASMMNSSNYCIHITYDENGNRTAQSDTSVTTTQTTWGSGTYACFTWSE